MNPKKDHKNEKADLEVVEHLIVACGLATERFSKVKLRSGKSPDFRVLQNGKLVAYCEVKSPHDDWLDQQEAEAGGQGIFGGGRPDPTFNRIGRQIEHAALQFESVNPNHILPNVLIFVNHDESSGFGDLYETITGCFVSEDGHHHPTAKNVSEGKIRESKLIIDLYAWIDLNAKRPRWLLTDPNLPHASKCISLFGLENLVPQHSRISNS